eukprot:IDg3103t1
MSAQFNGAVNVPTPSCSLLVAMSGLHPSGVGAGGHERSDPPRAARIRRPRPAPRAPPLAGHLQCAVRDAAHAQNAVDARAAHHCRDRPARPSAAAAAALARWSRAAHGPLAHVWPRSARAPREIPAPPPTRTLLGPLAVSVRHECGACGASASRGCGCAQAHALRLLDACGRERAARTRAARVGSARPATRPPLPGLHRASTLRDAAHAQSSHIVRAAPHWRAHAARLPCGGTFAAASDAAALECVGLRTARAPREILALTAETNASRYVRGQRAPGVRRMRRGSQPGLRLRAHAVPTRSGGRVARGARPACGGLALAARCSGRR